MRSKSNPMKRKPATEPLCAPKKEEGRKAYVAFSFFLYQYAALHSAESYYLRELLSKGFIQHT
jgi:hypothetical protein